MSDLDIKIENKEIKVTEVKEGKVTIQQQNNDGTFSPFYNPAQELNRDISVACIQTYFEYYKEKIDKKQKKDEIKNERVIIDAMSATGLRAVRYFKEIEGVTKIIANDLDSKAVDLIKINAKKNGDENNIIHVTQEDCIALLYSKKSFYNVVDLDPYGTAIPMIDASLWGIKNEGLMMATFTDMQVLCGNYIDTCYYKYGSIPYKTPYCHEMAKRIALYSISCSAAKYKKTIIPLLSFNAEFYIRLIFIVKDSAEECKDNIDKHSQLLQCRSCQYRKVITKGNFEYKNDKKTRYKLSNYESKSDKCPVCEGNLVLIGPFWSEELYSIDYLNLLLNNLQSDKLQYLKYNKRIQAIVKGMKEELDIPKVIFNHDFSQMCSDVNVSVPKLSLFE